MSLTQVLIQAGSLVNDPDDSGMTPLVAACHTGQLKIVKALLTTRADPNLAEAEGQTPLIAAAEDGFASAVSLLVGARADVDTADSDGQTPLMAAAAEGYVDTARTLLEAGADASHCDAEGTAVLMVAEFDEEMMNMLLADGADVNSMDGDDETALFKATRLADAAYVTCYLSMVLSHTTSQLRTKVP